MRSDNRAVSTVVDVSLALLLMSAAVVILSYHVVERSNEERVDIRESQEVAETISATTITTDYRLTGVITDQKLSYGGSDDDEFTDPATYTRQVHGTTAELLAEAAVTSAEVDGTRLTKEGIDDRGPDFSEKLDGPIRDQITGSDTEAHVVAVWEPFPGSDFRGVCEGGPAPPTDADVSTTTMTVGIRIPELSDAEIRRADETGGIGEVAELVAEAMVEGYFPAQQTQLALEQQGLEPVVARHRYLQMKEAINAYNDAHVRGASDVDYDYPGPLGNRYIDRTYADADGANRRIEAGLAAAIKEDLDSTYESPSGEQLAQDVSPGTVTITVQTWEP
ncbi:DUF7284 family protein [Halosimplex sp. J119]